MKTLYINGKFTAQRVTGVQRAAAGLVTALDQYLASTRSADRWILLCPAGARPPTLKRIEVRFTKERSPSLHLWEQVVLPLHTSGYVLLNLAGPAPLLKFRQVCLLHDAAGFDHPDAYNWAFRTWYRLLFWTISHTSPLLLTVSEFSRQRLIHFLGHAAPRLRVVHNAADHVKAIVPDASVLDRFGLRQARYLLAVASLNPTKNLPALVEAFRRCHDDGIRLVLVGGQNATVFAEVANLGAGDQRIIRTGAVTDGELVALYRHAVAFVFPSLYEGFGIPPLEAMMLDCPVVAARAASIPEVCGDAALYFDPTSVPGMAQALQRILQEPALRADLGRRGAARARQFTWARSAEQLFAWLARTGLVSPPAATRAAHSEAAE